MKNTPHHNAARAITTHLSKEAAAIIAAHMAFAASENDNATAQIRNLHYALVEAIGVDEFNRLQETMTR